MAKEALEKVRQAEEKAREITREASQKARDIRRDAETRAEERYKEIMNMAAKETEDLRERARLEGNRTPSQSWKVERRKQRNCQPWMKRFWKMQLILF